MLQKWLTIVNAIANEAENEKHRGRVVKAARLCADIRRKARVRGWASPCDDWKSLSTQQ